MRKVLSAAVAALAICVASPAAAQVTEGQYGDTTTVSGGYQLTSDPNAGAGYSGLYFNFDPGLTLGSLTELSADYQLTDGSFAVGSPRFTLFDSADGAAYIYFGTPNGNGTYSDPATGTTGNYADLLSGDLRVECNGFAGCTSPHYPAVTFADFVAQAGSTGISYLTLDLDGGYAGRQQITVSDFNVNGTHFGAAGAVPEPATWAMLLFGFGGIGFQIRRQRKQFVPQAA
jgi:hypothetical protein